MKFGGTTTLAIKSASKSLQVETKGRSRIDSTFGSNKKINKI